MLRTLALYVLVGVLHFVLRRRFHMISFEPEEAVRQGIRVRLWDFVFYATFGLVVTSFVRIAGSRSQPESAACSYPPSGRAWTCLQGRRSSAFSGCYCS